MPSGIGFWGSKTLSLSPKSFTSALGAGFCATLVADRSEDEVEERCCADPHPGRSMSAARLCINPVLFPAPDLWPFPRLPAQGRRSHT